MDAALARNRPASPLPTASGTYVLLLRLRRSTPIRIGHLGAIPFKRGWYAYVGSAFGPGGLAARLGRHLRAEKKPRWHIDYLRAMAEPRRIWSSTAPEPLEHTWAAILSRYATKSIPGFGCSDCRCPSHLFYFNSEPREAFPGSALRSYRLENAP
ncbi:MAG: GIY-YIG nuclease family protein [Desulfatitalea sp.]|nr:GIY-YIG nuclease family protein [Desulfatitalea sp.]